MRYLSSLEHTEENTGFNPSCCCAGCLPALLAVAWGIFAGFSTSVWLVIVAAIIMAIISSYLSSGTVKTSPEGISYDRPLRKKFIAWSDVVGALTLFEQRHSWAVIGTSTNIIKLALPIDESNAQVDASVWQHLHKHGKTGNYIPSDDVLSIWADIPDDIPQEMDYCHEEVKDVSPATRYQLRDDFISEEFPDIPADELKNTNQSENRRVIKWNDVTDVSWDHDNDFLYLNVESSSGDIISVQNWSYDSKDETDIQSAKFILAVIRRARMIESQPAIFIPEHIRKACGVEV